MGLELARINDGDVEFFVNRFGEDAMRALMESRREIPDEGGGGPRLDAKLKAAVEKAYKTLCGLRDGARERTMTALNARFPEPDPKARYSTEADPLEFGV